ncbi:hypothetical protein MTR67_007399 [Solanum verrucosum]|uniref:Uncharacterized protein n=1 Tax=Solanum verrucosum TaxID=315347 RepID=A0AAF0Q623_SOLVR|nr:hypothetical protein MTR67_007399 [Solanum verrucosum]
MTSPKCKRLELIHHGHPYGDWYSFEGDTCCFEIVTPYVKHLTISEVFNDTRIKLRDFSSLNHANLDLDFDEFDEMDENIVKDILVSARCANELILSSWFIKVISILMLEEEDVSLPLLECRWLTISSCISKLLFPLLDNLLKATPKLENLMIFPDRTYHPFYEDEEIDLLEDKKYLSIEENIFKVSLQNLKNVKDQLVIMFSIPSFASSVSFNDDSSYRTDDDVAALMLFVKQWVEDLFFDHSAAID